ncbi:hypothetical protein CC86DRAFT_451720 [Ophiobolus disseminans]|uniref:3'-5' exonuclease domain-containing protein n=1 Tax=Ophiobolus disseminans TaxID=1469910 RepID=A0A6A7AFI6_9PLEO|nr:hypothetical protein CC86DRAFT_451720 [Ophiobolus disseminans]
MLFSRRASLSSASYLRRRACDERAADSVHTRTCQPTISRTPSLRLAGPFFRAMHTTTPPPKSPTSPNSGSRWKRGRPVSARHSSANAMKGGSTLLSPQPPSQISQAVHGAVLSGQGQVEPASHAKEPEARDDGDLEAVLSGALQNMQLRGDAKALRFTPTVRREAQHTMARVADVESAPPLHAIEPPVLNGDTKRESPGQTEAEGAQLTEQKALLNNEPASQNNNTMEPASDSDYVPSQAKDSNASEEDAEAQVVENEQDEESQDVEEQDEEIEEHTDLDYQIPEGVLRAAMQASPNTRASFWSTKLYRGPEGQPPVVHYCRSMDVAERVAQHFVDEEVLGFDIEWKPDFEWRPHLKCTSIKENASLIQLACENRIALFHISLFEGTTAEELMPPTVKAILESPDIYKVGVAVKGDFSRLQKYLNVQSQGVFELSRLHNLVEFHATKPLDKIGNKLAGLAAQVHQHLQLPLYKGEQLDDDPENTASVRQSNWSKVLDLPQIHYAAADAYAGFRLYHMLEWKRKQLRPTPPTRGLCDYDAKPKPRLPTKKKVTRKVKDVGNASAEETCSAVEQEAEDAEEEDGYETAPEELVNTHELEDLVDTSPEQVTLPGLADSGSTRSRKRIGRVNLPWLKGPDPGYPVLPQEPEAKSSVSDSAPIFQHSARTVEDNADAATSNTRLPRLQTDEEDEFADPELEEALQVMDLDTEGKLRDFATSATTVTASGGNHHTYLKRPSRKDNDVEMSDDSPVSPESEDPTAVSPLTFQPLTVPADETVRSPQYTQAQIWSQEYLRSTVPSPKTKAPSGIRATLPHLRAYNLWHIQHLSLDDIAGHLRDPPLSHLTVWGYIMQAVTLERLTYDKDAMRELLMGMPAALRKGKWKRMAETVGVLD